MADPRPPSSTGAIPAPDPRTAAGSVPAGGTSEEVRLDTGTHSSSSIGELLGHTMEEVSTLFRQEIELAKAELRVEVGKARAEVGKAQAEAKKAGKAAGKLGVAGALGYLALLLVTFAAAWGLAELIPVGWAFLVVAVVVAAIAFGIYSAGRKQLQDVSFDNVDFSRIDPKPDQAIEELKETKQWAKQQ